MQWPPPGDGAAAIAFTHQALPSPGAIRRLIGAADVLLPAVGVPGGIARVGGIAEFPGARMAGSASAWIAARCRRRHHRLAAGVVITRDRGIRVAAIAVQFAQDV